MKLTKRQLELLRKARLYHSGGGYDTYGPLMKTAVSLERHGLVTLSAGWPTMSVIYITEAGRAALKEKAE